MSENAQRAVVPLDEAIHGQVVAIQTLLHDLPNLLVARANQVIAADQTALVERFEHAARALQDAVDKGQSDHDALWAFAKEVSAELTATRKHVLLELPAADQWDLIRDFRELTEEVEKLKHEVAELKRGQVSKEAGS